VTFRFGEERVITTAANVWSGVKFGSALPDNDVARFHVLAARLLQTQPFRF
jgi:hypothetical protein